MNNTNSNSNSDSNSPTPPPDPLDGLLADWNARVDCPPDQVARMWARVSAALQADPHEVRATELLGQVNGFTEHPLAVNEEPQSVDPSPRRLWRGPLLSGLLAVVAAGIALAIGPLFFNGSVVPKADGLAGTVTAEDPLQQFAFSDDELHHTQILATEIQRLYSKPVVARKTEAGWDIDEIQTTELEVTGERPTLVIRCLVMEAAAAVDGVAQPWQVVAQEELITNVEYQHFAAKDQPGDVEAWVHLLPDNRLWAECHDDVRETAFVLQPNQPSVLWEVKSNGSSSRRFVVVFECLDPNDA